MKYTYCIGTPLYDVIVKLSVYAWTLLPPEQKQMAYVYHLLDTQNQYYRGKDLSIYQCPLYGLDPYRDRVYEIPYADSIVEMEFQKKDPNHLYPFIDKNVYDIVYDLRLQALSTEIIESFIKDALHYFDQHFFSMDNQEQLIIFHYCEFWDQFQKIRRRSIQTIYLPNDQAFTLLKDVRHFLSNDTKELYHTFGIPYHRTYCLYGPPGTGKTSLIKSIASEIGKHISIIRFDNQMKDSSFANALRWLPKNSILVLEDIDCILNHREKNVQGQLTFSGLLNLLDGLSSIEGLITFTTSNMIHEFDEALRRPGRIDSFLEFNYLSKDQLTQMVQAYYPEEIKDIPLIYAEIQTLEISVAHFQHFLFSLYPTGNILKHLIKFISSFHKYQQGYSSVIKSSFYF